MPKHLPFPSATFVIEVLLPVGACRSQWAAQVLKEKLEGVLVVEEVKHHAALEVMWDDRLRPFEHVGLTAFFDNRVRAEDGTVTPPLDSQKVMKFVRDAMDAIAQDPATGGFVVAQVRNHYIDAQANDSHFDMFLELRLPVDLKGQYTPEMVLSRGGPGALQAGSHSWQWREISTPNQNQRLNNEFDSHLHSMESKEGVRRRAMDWLNAHHLEQTLPSAPTRPPGLRF